MKIDLGIIKKLKCQGLAISWAMESEKEGRSKKMTFGFLALATVTVLVVTREKIEEEVGL